MEFKSSFDKLLSVKMTDQLMCFGGWILDVGITKPEYLEEFEKFIEDFSFKTQKNSDIAKNLIKLIKEKKVVVRRQLTEEECKTRMSRIQELLKNNPKPSEFEINKEAEFEWQCVFDWKTALLPILEGKFDK
tara:strand:- start:935 stop:1330 length:396 start_codon:yes stop_codon:yes gene_type:complete